MSFVVCLEKNKQINSNQNSSLVWENSRSYFDAILPSPTHWWKDTTFIHMKEKQHNCQLFVKARFSYKGILNIGPGRLRSEVRSKFETRVIDEPHWKTFSIYFFNMFASKAAYLNIWDDKFIALFFCDYRRFLRISNSASQHI